MDTVMAALVISGLSLFVSIVSAILASRANAKANVLSKERNELALRQARASEHAIFVQSLFDVNQRLQDLLREFRNEAEKAYYNIANMFDSYDLQRNHTRPLRHIYGTFCDLIYAALCYQIVWQTNIHFRLPALWNGTRYDRENNKRLIQMLNGVMYNNSFPRHNGIFKWFECRPPVKEDMLAKGIYEIYRRTDGREEMFVKAYNYCQKYFELFDKLEPAVKKCLKELNDLLDIDRHKEFKLYESYPLYEEYMSAIKKLTFLSACGMNFMRQQHDWLHDEFSDISRLKKDWIGDLLYMGVILSIITHYYTWGTDPVIARNMFGNL
jgi:hypothetical protein